MSLLTLFISGFTSATLLPGSSEALFLLMLSEQAWSTGLLILVVGAGNSLGGMTNWVLGYAIRKGFYRDKRGKSQASQRRKAELWLSKHGAPVLFFSFLPIIGDPLCLVAGLIKIPWFLALVYIALGKFFRYVLLSYLLF